MQNSKGPPDLDRYLEGRNHKYRTYQQAAKQYGMSYWGFVSVAKEAKATWKLRKTAIVDTVIFDKYLEAHCVVTEDDDVIYETEEMDMPRARKEIKNMDELIKSKKKKYVRYAEGAELFSMGLHTFQQLAKDAGAVRKVKGCVLVNLEKVEQFVESFAEEDI